jgi:5-formyltetrahydrofolate cyclo-ligase
LLAGNIVQVRLERKALSAAVGPTCCSGREQRSKTAFAGSAIPFPMSPTLKSVVRKQLRAARRSLSTAAHRRHSGGAALAVTRLAGFRAGKRLAVYLPFDRETDTAALIAMARRRGLRIYVPVITDKRHARMRFLPLGFRTRLGTFGISVPHRPGVPVAARWLNLIVVPLVGVDAAGRRLGMGGGYYDRALAFRRLRRSWQGPHLVGLSFDCQRTAASFAEHWDVRLNSLATESGVQHFL